MSKQSRRANRQNAQRSTGPITPAGKAQSSQNATTHGAYSKAVLLPVEDAAQFQQLGDEIFNRFHPETPEEIQLATTIHESEWRLRRVLRIERSTFMLTAMEHEVILKTQLGDQINQMSRETFEQLVEASAYAANKRLFAQLRRDEILFRKLIAQATEQLKALLEARQPAEEEPVTPPETGNRVRSVSAEIEPVEAAPAIAATATPTAQAA